MGDHDQQWASVSRPATEVASIRLRIRRRLCSSISECTDNARNNVVSRSRYARSLIFASAEASDGNVSERSRRISASSCASLLSAPVSMLSNTRTDSSLRPCPHSAALRFTALSRSPACRNRCSTSNRDPPRHRQKQPIRLRTRPLVAPSCRVSWRSSFSALERSPSAKLRRSSDEMRSESFGNLSRIPCTNARAAGKSP